MDAVKKYSREALVNEMGYRRDRRHAVFSWCSGILVAIIGGIAGVTSKSIHIGGSQKLALLIAILVLSGFTEIWIYHHWDTETKIQSEIDSLDVDLKLTKIDKPMFRFDYLQMGAILLLGIAAVVAVSTN